VPATQKEETMRLITTIELAQRSESELAALFALVSRGLVRTRRETAERRCALASLENISRERAQRLAGQGP
jgi:hypothetical protein